MSVIETIKERLLRCYCKWLRHTRKNNHLVFYAKGFLRYYCPRRLTQWRLNGLLNRFNQLSAEEQAYILDRVDYYCKFKKKITLPDDAPRLRAFTYKAKENYVHDYVNSSYFFDAIEYIRYFDQDLRWAYNPGDVNYLFPLPEITKSRPLLPDNQNNILLNLDKVRHFTWVYDPYTWEQKQCRIIFRGDVNGKPRRQAFIKMWQKHPLCDIQEGGNLSLFDHLRYRYIMSLEGNDVASNLKWVMSSNSVAVMPRPTCETWYMEARLKPGYHYIEISADYHDLMDKIQYYEAHPDEVKAIIEHAHEWVAQFQVQWREDLISLMVLDKYFRLTEQKKPHRYLFNDKVKLVFAQTVNAQSKAREDVVRTAIRQGVTVHTINQYRYSLGKEKRYHHYPWFTTMAALWQAHYHIKHVMVGDVIYIQDFSLPYMRGIARRCRKRGARIIYLIHDVQCMRFADVSPREIYFLNEADELIVHTPAMVRRLHDVGVTRPMRVLQIFDYYSDDGMLPLTELEKERHTVVFAGNLEKSVFLAPLMERHWSENFLLRLYGFWGKREPLQAPNLDYAGIFSPNKTGGIHGGWGLVWDGDSIETCNGDYGEYLRHNASHKASLYLTCGFPLIVWEESALAVFVKEHQCGITLSSLCHIDEVLDAITQEQYRTHAHHARQIGTLLRHGYYLSKQL